jgi:hypothetical protein
MLQTFCERIESIYQLSTTTYLFCFFNRIHSLVFHLCWLINFWMGPIPAVINNLLIFAWHGLHLLGFYSVVQPLTITTLSLLSIVLLSGCGERMISIPTVDNKQLIFFWMAWTSFYWRFIMWLQPTTTSLSLLRFVLLSCCDGRMILISAINNN